MKFERGTPACGIFIGILCAVAGALVMTIGFWKTLVLALLFGAGYFIGAVSDKSGFVKSVANKAIPDKENKTIDLRETLVREQQNSMPGRKNEDADDE